MKGSFPVNYRLFQFVTVCFIFILSLALLTTSFILLSEELHKKVDQGLTAIMVVHVCEIYMTLSSFINCLVVKAQHLARISLTAGGKSNVHCN